MILRFGLSANQDLEAWYKKCLMGQSPMRKFLGRVADVLTEYLGGLNEDLVKDNFVIIYQVTLMIRQLLVLC